MLLVAQGDVEADGATAVFVGATVCGFHDARAATSDDGVAILGEKLTEFAGFFVVFVLFGETGGTEDGNALREGADDPEDV